MTLAYLSSNDAWQLARGARSKLRPLICHRPRKPVRLTLDAINAHFKNANN